MDKKMKRASVSCDQSHVIGDEAKAKFEYQTLLKKYLELQKECVSRKRKLQAAKQKRETILAEVRFLRRRRNFLRKCQASYMKELPLHLPNPDIESNAFQREGIQSTSEAAPSNFDLVSTRRLKNKEEVGSVNDKDVKFRKKLKNQGTGSKGKGQGFMRMGDQKWHRQATSIASAHLKSAQMVEPTS